jgi:hypothetical protein
MATEAENVCGRPTEAYPSRFFVPEGITFETNAKAITRGIVYGWSKPSMRATSLAMKNNLDGACNVFDVIPCKHPFLP